MLISADHAGQDDAGVEDLEADPDQAEQEEEAIRSGR